MERQNNFLRFSIGLILAVTMIGGFRTYYTADIPKVFAYLLLGVELIIPYLVVRFKCYKSFAITTIFYVLVWGVIGEIPTILELQETIRNLYFHVPMWFSMIILLLVSVIFSIKYLNSGELVYDKWAKQFAYSGLLFGMIGITTGMLWATYTWGKFWSGDPKQNAAAIGLLAYFAYVIIQGSFTDDIQRAKISAVYNVFAYPLLVVLLFILPRMSGSSLHPGNSGNPAFSEMDLNNGMRVVFYPAIIGWTLLGVWITEVRVKTSIIKDKLYGIV